MPTLESYSSLKQSFLERTKNIESIFTSFKTLYEIYSSALGAARPTSNTQQAFERAKRSAEEKQNEISEELHAQGLVLLTGAAEALLKDLFESLLIENFTSLKSAKNVNFSVGDVQEILNRAEDGFDDLYHLSGEFGRLTKQKLFKNQKQPSDKINFQNVETMIEDFEQYFGINIAQDITTENIHRNWQIRHCIIHNNFIIDERFINNVQKVKLLKEDEKVGYRLKVKKSDYDDAKKHFNNLFATIDKSIKQSDLETRFSKTK